MSIKKTVAIAAAAGALTAVAMPALAFENEVHGIYNLKFFMSNYENGSSAVLEPQAAYANKNKANNFFEQRARLQYIAKASDDLKLVTQFELDTKFGGDASTKYLGSSDGGVKDADGVSLETKHVYLDFNVGKSLNVKTGIMPVKDAYKGRFVDLDLTGVLATAKLGAATLGTGYYRYNTESNSAIAFTNTSKIGHDNADLFILDGKYALNKSVNLGASYYLSSDYTAAAPNTVHFFGVNADAKVGPATVSGFFAAETGRTGAGTAKKALSGYAANLAAKAAVGPGTLRTAFLWESGDGNTNGNNTTYTGVAKGVTYAEGAMMLLVRTGVGGTSNDRTIVHYNGAGNPGLFLCTLGYDATITPKMYANVNAGIAMVAKSSAAPINNRNASDVIGTEINLETGYKLYDNLTAKVQGAYVFLGGIYDKSGVAGKTPENPYTARVGLSYAF